MPKTRLLDVVRDRIRVKHYSYRTETGYLGWIRRFIRFHGGRHPREMGGPEVEQFLSYLATERQVAASTHNQARSAILFLYRETLEIDLPWLDGVVRAKRPARVPVVLSRAEVRRVLAQLEGTHWLAASLLYGAGLRVSECLRLRVKDVDFEYRQITVRDGKGAKDRCTMLPDSVLEPLQLHLGRVRSLFDADRAASHPGAVRPRGMQSVGLTREHRSFVPYSRRPPMRPDGPRHSRLDLVLVQLRNSITSLCHLPIIQRPSTFDTLTEMIRSGVLRNTRASASQGSSAVYVQRVDAGPIWMMGSA